jgi:hypothetical protein
VNNEDQIKVSHRIPWLELFTNNFGGTKLTGIYIWNKKVGYHWSRIWSCKSPGCSPSFQRSILPALEARRIRVTQASRKKKAIGLYDVALRWFHSKPRGNSSYLHYTFVNQSFWGHCSVVRLPASSVYVQNLFPILRRTFLAVSTRILWVGAGKIWPFTSISWKKCTTTN